MLLLLDTSTALCKLTLYDSDTTQTFSSDWQADRNLAKGLISFLRAELKAHHMTLQDITGIGIYKGPGSFTGLRIGITVLNTIADDIKVPIVGETGIDWQENAVLRLVGGENDKMILPEYGRAATITTPRK